MTTQTLISMSCDEVLEALSAYALGILEPDEQRAVQHHLATCADCRTALKPLERVTSSLAFAAPTARPPDALKARILAATERPMPTPAVAPASPAAPVSRTVLVVSRWTILPAAAAVTILIVAVAVLAALFVEARQDRDAAISAERILADYLSAGGQITKLSVPPASDDGTYYGHGTLVTVPGRAPIVVVGGCKPTDDERSYRVWVAEGSDRTRVGELRVGADGDGWLEVDVGQPLDQFDTVGITMVTNGDQRQDVLVAPLTQTMTG
jgi:hypothetical protein